MNLKATTFLPSEDEHIANVANAEFENVTSFEILLRELEKADHFLQTSQNQNFDPFL